MTTKTTPTTKTAETATRHDGYYSHSVTFQNTSTDLAKEELFPRWITKWRGRDVLVVMGMDRYAAGMDRDHLEMGSWRIYAREARELQVNDDGTPQQYQGGAHLTDTARRRLSDDLQPLAVEYLSSEHYKASRARALTSAILDEITGRPFRSDTLRARRLLDAYADQLTPEKVAQLVAAFDARDAYDATYSIAADIS